MAEFNIGDVVQLKSGSPDMTVEEFLDEEREEIDHMNRQGKPVFARCQWSVKGEARAEVYPLASLQVGGPVPIVIDKLNQG